MVNVQRLVNLRKVVCLLLIASTIAYVSISMGAKKLHKISPVMKMWKENPEHTAKYPQEMTKLMRDEPTNPPEGHKPINVKPVETKVIRTGDITLTPYNDQGSELKGNSYNKNYITTDPMNPGLQAELSRRLQNATERKTILIWRPAYGVEREHKIDSYKCGNCLVSYDKTKITDNSTGAVIFHYEPRNNPLMPPRNERNPNQLYVYWVKDPPYALKVNRHLDLNFEDSYGFNATMSFRRNSDFYDNFGPSGLSNIVGQNEHALSELLKLKTKMALAVVSDCVRNAGARTRFKMLKELKGMNFGLEAFGGCFPESGNLFARGPNEREIFRLEARKYKFYLAFENSHHCKDYITEKFFRNGLSCLSVPVVWGAKKEEYELLAPPGSFIFAEDFPSLEKLVEYLIYLDNNDTAYLEYLRWITMKPEELPEYGREKSFCVICRALHGINIDDLYNPDYNASNPARPLFTDGGVSRRIMPSLKDWYYGENDKECFEE